MGDPLATLLDPKPGSQPAATPAKHLRDFVGVCAHFEWRTGSVYGDGTDPGPTQAVLDLMTEAGVAWWRGGVHSTGNYAGWFPARLQQILNSGLSASFLIDEATQTGTDSQLNWLVNNWPAEKLVGLEWPNEADLFWGKQGGDPNWATALAQQGKRILDGRASRQGLWLTPIIGPSFGAFSGVPGSDGSFSGSSQCVEDAWVALGYGNPDVAYDYRNSHCYAGEGYGGDTHLNKEVTRHTFGPTTMVATEHGWHTISPAFSGGQVTERVQAIHQQRLWLTGFRLGWKGMASYEFCDQNTADPTNGERHYGMIHSDLSPKVVWSTLKSQSAVLGPSQLPEIPSGADITVTGPADMRYIVVQRADSRHVVVVWRDVSVWNGSQEVTPAAANVSITSQAGAWEVHNCVEQTVTPTPSYGTLQLPVSGTALFVVV